MATFRGEPPGFSVFFPSSARIEVVVNEPTTAAMQVILNIAFSKKDRNK
jgi:hypothetical protein